MSSAAVCFLWPSTSDSSEQLAEYSRVLTQIFSAYQLQLQQYITNCDALQKELDSKCDESTAECVKLLGMEYDRTHDRISTIKLKLNPSASTKREVISTIASNYNPLQINGPLMNRARLFAHKLQSDSKTGWDDTISVTDQKEWKNISRQLNSAPSLSINRCVGSRFSEYELAIFTDASKFIYGSVLYLRDKTTGVLSYVRSTNRMVTKLLKSKSMPSLELHAIQHGVKVLMETYSDMCGEKSVCPLQITDLRLFSDSMVALSWIDSYVNKLDKTQKLSPFVSNRIELISKLCETKSVSFNFVAGNENPADFATRAVSYSVLKDTRFLKGPNLLFNSDLYSNGGFKVPNFIAESENLSYLNVAMVDHFNSHLIPLERFSSLSKLVKVHQYVRLFINIIRERLMLRFCLI